jgi:hypothetical protein
MELSRTIKRALVLTLRDFDCFTPRAKTSQIQSLVAARASHAPLAGPVDLIDLDQCE